MPTFKMLEIACEWERATRNTAFLPANVNKT